MFDTSPLENLQQLSEALFSLHWVTVKTFGKGVIQKYVIEHIMLKLLANLLILLFVTDAIVSTYIGFQYFSLYLADPGEARDCSTNINYLTD